MRVNLLEKDEGIKINWLEVVAAVAIILTLAVPAVNYYLNHLEVENLKQRKKNWETRVNALQPEEEYYYQLEEEISSFKLPEKVELEKYTISPFFLEFAKIIDEDINFNTLDYSSGSVIINGKADSVRDLLDFSGRIFESEVFSIISLERFQRNDELEFNLEVQLNNRKKGVIYSD